MSEARWLEDPSADRQEEEQIMVWHSDSVAWAASWTAAIQGWALQWGPCTQPLICPDLRSCAPWCSSRSFVCPAYRKLLCICFLMLKKWAVSPLFLFDSTETLHAASYVFSPFPTGHNITPPALSGSPLDAISKLSCEPDCLKAAGKPCRDARVDKSAAAIPMI